MYVHVCSVLFFLKSYQWFLMFGVGRFYGFVYYLFFLSKGKYFSKLIWVENSLAMYCPNDWMANDKDDSKKKKKNICSDLKKKQLYT